MQGLKQNKVKILQYTVQYTKSPMETDSYFKVK